MSKGIFQTNYDFVQCESGSKQNVGAWIVSGQCNNVNSPLVQEAQYVMLARVMRTWSDNVKFLEVFSEKSFQGSHMQELCLELVGFLCWLRTPFDRATMSFTT
jgi:hypothetical protein